MWILNILIVFLFSECILGDNLNATTIFPRRYYDSLKLRRSIDQQPPAKLAVCCSPGFFMASSKCWRNTTQPIYDIEIPPIFTNKLKLSSRSPDDFNQIYRVPCKHGLFALQEGSDEFYLLENGSVYLDNSKHVDQMNRKIPDEMLNIDDYCLANLMGENGSFTVIAQCLPPEIKYAGIPVLYPIAMAMSLPFLVITFFVYAFLPELRNIHGMTLMAYVGSLFWAYVGLVLVQVEVATATDTRNTCIVTAFIIHFSFLSSFFWLNVMCFDIWWTFGGFRALQGSVKQRERKKFIIYSIYAWGCASIMTGICLIMDFVPGIPDHYIKPSFGELSCWFKDDYAKAVYFYGPMGITVLCNIFLFISTALKILKHKKDTAHQLKGMDSRRHDDNKQWFNLYLKLFIVMGINWSMEIISWLCKDTPQYVWYITDLANTLQGVIIFIIFVWKDKIKRLLLKRFGCQNRSFQSRNSTRSGYHSSASNRTCNSTVMASLNDKNHLSFDKSRGTTTDESDCV